MEFKFIGFDIRCPVSSGISADATVWPQDMVRYEKVQRELGLKENSLQLICVETKEQFIELKQFVRRDGGGAVLLSFEIYDFVRRTLIGMGRYGFTAYEPDLSGWIDLGLDVCDVNGYFSIFNMGVLPVEESLVGIDRSDVAHGICEAANILVKEHSPFVTVRLRSYQGVV